MIFKYRCSSCLTEMKSGVRRAIIAQDKPHTYTDEKGVKEECSGQFVLLRRLE